MPVFAGGLIDAADFGTSGGATVSLSGGVTDGDTYAWLVGGVAGLRYESRIGTAVHNTVIGTVPVGYRPPWTVTIPLSPNNSTPNQAFIQVNSSGVITLFLYGTTASTTFIRGSASWPKAS